jgi:uncharacterized protein
MSLQEKIRLDLGHAIKARDQEKKEGLRVIIGEFGRMDKKELTDDEVIKVLKKLYKNEKELLDKKKAADDTEFIRIIETYLPKPADAEEIVSWINAHVDFAKFKNKMQAMAMIMKHFGARVDGDQVKKILQTL